MSTGLVKKCCTFQFTTSQGGRLMYPITIQDQDFLSIHDLTRRSTVPRGLPLPLDPFNSRPHKEVDSNLLQYYSKYLRYFLHFV